MTRDRSTSFWDEAALRLQRQSIHVTLAKHEAQLQAPAALPPQQQPEPPPQPVSRKSLRRDAPPLPPALVTTDDALKLRLAEELEYARRMLDLMGDALAADRALLTRHGVALQSVDIVGQIMGHVANVIRSSDPEGAVERIGMAELKARLQRSSID